MVNNLVDTNKVLDVLDPDARLVSISVVPGGVTAETSLIEYITTNETKKVICRKFPVGNHAKYYKKVENEVKLLTILQDLSFPGPKVLFSDYKNETFHFPLIILEYIDGETIFNNNDIIHYIGEFTRNLVAIHSIDLTKVNFSFLPNLEELIKEELSKVASYESIKNLLKSSLEEPINELINAKVLVHGDYWPGNLLWLNGKINATIDWEDACVGNPLYDIATARLELLWAFDEHAMKHFTDFYKKLIPNTNFEYLPIWDLVVIERKKRVIDTWGLDAYKVNAMKVKLDWFERKALNNLKRF